MIFRLEYKNKALKTARVDIVTPTGTGVETVEGTGYPFRLKYEGDKKNKSLMFLSSSAEINIYETPLFNIDTLKTSGEKDIKVNYYIDSVLEWTGFVIPDFFSREIGGDGVVSMVASDRLSVLDSEVLEGLPVTVTLRTLLSSSLAKTGLVLPLKTVVDFGTISGDTNIILNHSVRSQRFTDTKGRSVNCKDIIKSILVATNSKLMQRKGEWWVVNKMQHELGGGRAYTSPTAFTNYVEDLISFTDVTRGAMRTIAPVAGGVGVFQEYGGGKLSPDNYNFKNGLTGWTNYNSFTASTNDRRVLGYTQSGNVYTPIYDAAGTSEAYLVNRNLIPLWPVFENFDKFWNPFTLPSVRVNVPIVSGNANSAKISIDINATGRNSTFLPFIVLLKRPGRQDLFFNRKNEWQSVHVALLLSFKNEGANNLAAVSAGMSVNAVVDAATDGTVIDDVGTYSIELLIFGSGLQGDTTVDNTTLINSASVQFSAASNDNPKGTLYKADQGGESYTKIHDTETTVFGDYLTGGLNGYFYNYAPDDTSSLLAPNGSRSQPAWVNTFTQNTDPLPLLQQTIRQMRRMFSVAHDFIKGEIDVSDFDPLSIFEDCERRFVIVEAEFDFLRGSLQVVLEEVAYQNLTVREYIYSYFGDGDEGIRGISGISAGSSGGGGGGIAPEPSWLENEITIDTDSGLLSVDGWHVRGNLIIEGQVNQWLAQQLVVDDARIQVNRRQGGATVESGLVIYNKDTSSEVSSLVYDVNGIWRAGGQRLFTDDYNPMLGGYSAASYPRKDENAVITGAWNVFGTGERLSITTGTENNPYGWIRFRDSIGTNFAFIGFASLSDNHLSIVQNIGNGRLSVQNNGHLHYNKSVGIGTVLGSAPSELLEVAGSVKIEGDLRLGTSGPKNIYGSSIRFRDASNKALVVSADGSGLFYFRPEGDSIPTNQTLISNVGISTPALAVAGTSTLTGAVTAGGNVGGAGTFVGGFAGSNWRLEQANNHLTVDSLTVRGQLSVYELVVNQIRATNGALWVSDAMKTTTIALASADIYRISFDTDNGRIINTFSANDIVKAQRFDGKNIVVIVGRVVNWDNAAGWFQISTVGYTAPIGTLSNFVGLDFVRIGNTTVTNRQGALYLTSSDNNAPYLDVLDGVNTGSFAGKTKVRLGRLDGITDADLGTLTGYGLYAENAYLKGKVVANEGLIANFEIFRNAGISSLSYGTANMKTTPYDSTAEGMAIYAQNTDKRIVVKALGDNYVDLRQGPFGWGIAGVKEGLTVFRLGSANQIAGINFDDSRLYTARYEFNKDGSGNLAGGKISWDAVGNAQFDGSIITGLIQSQNWDGENGTRINLIDGSMDYGNVIHVNANAGEISFRDLNADRLGVRLGDFDLSPAVAGISYDQNLSSLGMGGGYAWSLTRWISSSGVGPNELVFTTVSQNTYNFSYPLQAALGRNFPNLFTGLPLQEGYTGGLSVKVTVYLEGTIIQQSESQIPSYFGAFSQPIATLIMPVDFNFTGSGQLKVKIELTGFGGYRDFQGNQYHPTSVVSLGATTIKVTPSTSVTELSTKGFQSLWGPTKYFRVYDKAGIDNFVETRGVQQYISPNGTFRLRVSDAGIQKSTDGGSQWTTL